MASSRLRILPQDLWSAVRGREKARIAAIGERVKAGLTAAQAKHTGRGPKYLFSGLLQCGTCVSSFVMANLTSYACSGRLYGGTHLCNNTARLKRTDVEEGLLAGIREQLLAPDVERTVTQLASQMLQERARRPAVDAATITKLEAQIANLTDAIASGALRTSPALAARLAGAERELARLRQQQTGGGENVARLVPRLMDEYRDLVANLPERLNGQHVHRARAKLRKLYPSIRVVTTPDEIRLEADQSVEGALLRAVGGPQINLVPGRGLEPPTHALRMRCSAS